MDSLELWIADLDALPSRDELLSPDERERAARFRFARDRIRFARCRALLRLVIAHATRSDAASLVFHYGVYGKPRLRELHFNVSHAAQLAAIVLSREEPVGIDVEKIDPAADVMSLAHTAFSIDENAQLASLPHDARTAAFFRGWTRKEAYLKLLGTGLSLPSDSFTISLTETPSTSIGDCELHDIDVPAGFVCALAVPCAPADLCGGARIRPKVNRCDVTSSLLASLLPSP